MKTIYRTDKNPESGNTFTRIDNRAVTDERLSFGARGLLAYLLSKPDDWRVLSQNLYNESPAGRKAVDALLRELMRFGYLRRYRLQDERGQWGWITKVYENPAENPDYDPATGEVCTTKPKAQKGAIGEGDFCQSESPKTDNRKNRQSEKPTIGKTDNRFLGDIQTTESPTTESPTTEITNEGGSNNGAHPHFEKFLSEKDREFNSLRLEVANTVGYNTKLLKGRKLKELDEISATMQAEGIKPADVRDFSTWWYATFLGHKDRQQKTPPTLDQLGEKWGAFQKSRGSSAKKYIDLATGKAIEFSDDRTAGKYRPKSWAETQREKKGSKFAGEIPEDNIVSQLSKPGAFRL